MKLSNIKKREAIKQQYRAWIKELKDENILLEQEKEFGGKDTDAETIGYAAAKMEDLDPDIKESIFEFVSENYQDNIINLNKEKIKQLRIQLKKRLDNLK